MCYGVTAVNMLDEAAAGRLRPVFAGAVYPGLEQPEAP